MDNVDKLSDSERRSTGNGDRRPEGECYNCRGQGQVFPGFPGRPTWGPDTSRIITCPVCNGTGFVKGGQMPLF